MTDPLSQPSPPAGAYNPYAPPVAAPPVQVVTDQRFPSFWIYGFGVCQVSGLALDLIAVQGDHSISFGGIPQLVGPVLGLMWLRRQWARLPTHFQTVGGRGITPAQAALRHLLPFYNLYWMFAVQHALCRGLNGALTKSGRLPTAPTALATLCPITVVAATPLQLVLSGGLPTIGFTMAGATFAFGVLWCAYMIAVEQAFVNAKSAAA